MQRATTIRKIVGTFGALIFLIPFSGFPGEWKDALTVVFGGLIFFLVAYKPVLVEIFSIIRDLKKRKAKKKKKKKTKKDRLRKILHFRRGEKDEGAVDPEEEEDQKRNENLYDEH